jgi:protoheme IX farnesyltransferase
MLNLIARHALRLNAAVRLRAYWALIKSLQTGLLLYTGMAGYLSARPERVDWAALLGVAGSLALAISGSTVLNMVYDRDIDAIMQRTARRPLPAGVIGWREALALGLLLSVAGTGWALALAPLFGAVVFAGLFFDMVIYTMWLKRRTPWAAVWGGVSGGMPALAGRVLATGQIDFVGIMLALAVLLWIPTHIMTFSIKHAEDYGRAGVPVFPNVYGAMATRRIIAASTVLAAVMLSLAAWQIGLTFVWLHATVALGAVLIALALAAALFPSNRLTHILFKAASLYMLAAMGLIIAGSQL